MFQACRGLHCSSFLGLRFGILNKNHNKELQWSLWEVRRGHDLPFPTPPCRPRQLSTARDPTLNPQKHTLYQKSRQDRMFEASRIKVLKTKKRVSFMVGLDSSHLLFAVSGYRNRTVHAFRILDSGGVYTADAALPRCHTPEALQFAC